MLDFVNDFEEIVDNTDHLLVTHYEKSKEILKKWNL